jgi:hypothetical protein
VEAAVDLALQNHISSDRGASHLLMHGNESETTLGDQTMTPALLDRFIRKALIINCGWQSYRLKQSLNDISTKEEEKKSNQ